MGEIVKFVGGGTPSKSNPDFWNGNIVWLSSKEIKQQFISHGTYTITQKAVNQSATTLVEKDTPLIVYRSGILIHTFPIARPTQQVAINQDIKALLFDHSKIEVQFLVSQLEGQEKFILQNIVKSGTTVQSINMPDLVKLHFWITTLNEQKKIGVLFKQLDSTIALHQRKLDKLEQLKKGFLQRLFPSNGQKVPVIRFADFTADWEQRKLGEVTNSYSGGTPKVGKAEYYGGSIPFIRSAEINKTGTELSLTKEGLQSSSAKMVKFGDILYALYGATSGEVGISRINGAINQAILAIKPNEGYNIQFIFQSLKVQKQKIIDKYLQGGQGNLSGSIVKNVEIVFPYLEEQKKVGDFLKQLDDTIALHRKKINLLKLQKQSLLSKMFC